MAERHYEEDEGMTDLQYKGFLLDILSDWEHVLEIAKKDDNAVEIQKEIEKKIEKTKSKLAVLTQSAH